MSRPSTIAVVIVEDDDRYRQALELILDGMPGVVCVGAYPDAESLLGVDTIGAFDVLILDIGLPGMSGIEAIPAVRARWPQVEILIQTIYQDDDQVFEALCAGAAGYLLKNIPPTRLIEAVREVHEGGAPMTATIARKVVRFFRKPEVNNKALTERGNEVLAKLIEGKTNR